MSTCITCKHMVPLFPEAEFAAARLLNKTEYFKMKCNHSSDTKIEFTLTIEYLITPHHTECSRYAKMSRMPALPNTKC